MDSTYPFTYTYANNKNKSKSSIKGLTLKSKKQGKTVKRLARSVGNKNV